MSLAPDATNKPVSSKVSRTAATAIALALAGVAALSSILATPLRSSEEGIALLSEELTRPPGKTYALGINA